MFIVLPFLLDTFSQKKKSLIAPTPPILLRTATSTVRTAQADMWTTAPATVITSLIVDMMLVIVHNLRLFIIYVTPSAVSITAVILYK